jgi:hypothetical protein
MRQHQELVELEERVHQIVFQVLQLIMLEEEEVEQVKEKLLHLLFWEEREERVVVELEAEQDYQDQHHQLLQEQLILVEVVEDQEIKLE